MCRHQCMVTRRKNNQGNVTIPKGQHKAPVTNHKEMKMYEVSEKESKVTILRKLSELQENTMQQFNKTKKTIKSQNNKLIRDIKII